MSEVEDRKLLEPLSTVVYGGLRLLIGLFLAGLVLNAVNGSVPFWDGVNACVTADWISSSSAGTDAAFATRDGAHVSAVPQYCADRPSAWQRTLGILSEVPAFVLFVGGLALLDRLLRSAARDGAYTRQTAYRLRFLGWFLLVGSLVAEIVRAASQAALLATLADDAPGSPGTLLGALSFPYLAILTALGLLAFARVMRTGAAMREDLEGVV
ncbi:DUF2975 domain-containing protein [Streptomyces sp. NPDC058701]|uniref:DUF2975 domain-containing protein n=1 Tax=Streptomyces sp. NPDC058701 TaxID=3346608 RepID=UPI003665EBD9